VESSRQEDAENVGKKEYHGIFSRKEIKIALSRWAGLETFKTMHCICFIVAMERITR
jgi:hypothetical protein